MGLEKLPPTGIGAQDCQPVASRYTSYASLTKSVQCSGVFVLCCGSTSVVYTFGHSESEVLCEH